MACAMLAAVGRSFSLAPKGRLARPLCAATMDVGVEAPPRLKIKSIVEAEAPESLVGTRTVIKGWARTVRAQKALGFLEVNDGSSFGGLQCVFEARPR
ncbi:asparagine-tRNA ligase [Aureococcus anophagefferens]|nr:asparagine-tRNA ligase [Aureococcus anophagefferens]